MTLTDRLASVGAFAHRHLLPLVVAAYALAAVFPAPGLWVRGCVLASVGGATFTLPTALLAVLLFASAVGASASDLGGVVRRPVAVFAGLAANLLVPVGFLLVLRFGLRMWHDSREADSLLLGLAVVAAMPVAGSSAAWSSSAGGNVALSLGLVLGSTLLSPLTTPLVFALTGVSVGGTADPGAGASGFLLAVVVVPSVAGLLVRRVLGNERTARLKPLLKVVTVGVLLALCYCNAAVALPQVVAHPDWDYLALVAVAAGGLCVSAFAAGWGVAWAVRAGEADRRALLFGLGMSNNGTGLVLAATAMSSLPWAVCAVLTYNLVQHVVAGGVSRLLNRPAAGGTLTPCPRPHRSAAAPQPRPSASAGG